MQRLGNLGKVHINAAETGGNEWIGNSIIRALAGGSLLHEISLSSFSYLFTLFPQNYIIMLSFFRCFGTTK